MMDGGISDGLDVFKALALGAQLVFVGRPILWGLAVNGQTGAECVLKLYRNEFETTMMLAGATEINDINTSFLIMPHRNFSKL